MSLDVLLFVLRLGSAGLLLAILGALFVILWRDYRLALVQSSANQRAHGVLTALREVENHLVVTGEVYPLANLITIGRSPTHHIVIPDAFASSDHASIYRRHGQWWLEDKKSRNGTTLNRHPIQQPVVITHGDIIGIGNLYFRVDLEK